MKVLKSFYKYILYYRGHFYAYVLLGFVGRTSENLQPFFFKWLTASVTSGDYSQSMNLIVILLVVLILGTGAYSLSWLIGDRGILKSSMRLQLDVMKKIHSLDFTYHTEKSSGKLISIMKRGEDAFYNMFDVINVELYSAVLSLLFMLYAFSGLNIKYVSITIVAIIFSALAGSPIIRLQLKRRKAMTDAEDNVSGARVDNLVNFDTVKYFAKETFEQNRLKGLLDKWNKSTNSFLNTYRYLDLSVGNISNLALVGTILMAVIDLRSNTISVADFVLVSSFSASFFPRLMHIIMVFRNGARRFADLKAYLEVLDEQELVKDPENPLTINKPVGKIEFKNVNFAYQKSNPVFTHFNLTLVPGESVALVGLSGSGKTTLIKLLMRLYDVDSGEILIDGINIKNLSKSHLRSLMSLVPQDPLMFNQTIGYNVAYASMDSPESEVWKALELSKLDEFVKSQPNGLETQVGERGIKLSGGQRQRLAIARVMLERSKIIVLDEATSSLDSESEGVVQDAFWKLVKDSKEPRTSIIIAHRLSTVMRSDRIVVLDGGKIVESGSHKQLIKAKGLYHHLWSLQQDGFLKE